MNPLIVDSICLICLVINKILLHHRQFIFNQFQTLSNVMMHLCYITVIMLINLLMRRINMFDYLQYWLLVKLILVVNECRIVRYILIVLVTLVIHLLYHFFNLLQNTNILNNLILVLC